MAKTNEVIRQVSEAAIACEEKKAEDINILELDKAGGSFTDYFVICSGANPRQNQAVADEVERRLKTEGTRPAHVEGYQQGDWVLLDYVDFVVHVFSRRAREFYNLERLWKSAKQFTPEELRKKSGKRKAPAASPAKSAAKTLKRKTTAKKKAASPAAKRTRTGSKRS